LPEDIHMKWTQRLINFFATSLQRKLLLVVTVVVTLVMIAFGFYLVNSQRQTASTELEDRATRTADLLAQTTALPLWNIDTASIEAQFKALMADPEVSSVDVYETGKSQPTVTSAQKTAAVDPITREAEIILLRGEEQTSLGTVQIVYTRELLNRSLNQTQALIGLIVLALILLLVVSIYFVVGRLVTNPLHEMTALTSRVSAGDYTGRANLTSRDEVGTLATAFNSMTAQLKDTLAGFEQRVASRTRDLQLAAEVGRSASQLRDVDTLLANAVELIRSRFGLYYVQVYLVDPNRRALALRAGTGDVGLELKRRAHHLPISRGSINGTAVTEKRVVIVADTANSDMFRPNPLLPDTRSEMAVSLSVGDRVVGVLDLQSAQPGALTDENLPAFEALAGQLAIAVDNAVLFAEAEQARAEVEAQARRLTQSGWREFLDAVNRSERLGYTFDQLTLVPLTEPLLATANPAALDVPILVTGEPIGRIRLEHDTEVDQPWDSVDSDLVSSIAVRVATQVENLRLLAQAEQYRAEAEAAMRRLTREGWETLQTDSELAGYVYDLNEVRPVSEKSDGASVGVLRHSLVVRDEPIGELAVDVDADDDEAAEIVAAVAEQLSGHIETLRLSVQMQRALATTQKQAQREQALRQITNAVRSSNDPATIMRTAVRELGSILGRKTVIQMATIEQAEAAASNGQTSDSPVGASPISVVGGKA
jgi:GAF domain-containing protein/HAMP domain-containing protein